MTDLILEQFYRERLEEDIIFCLSERRSIPTEQAMHLYYNSKLADYIHEGLYGIQYLDYKVLTDYLEEEMRKNEGQGNKKEVAISQNMKEMGL